MRDLVVPASSLLLSLLAGAAHAGDDTPAKIDYKLTGSYYSAADGNDARDLNVRASYGVSNAWLGQYRDQQGFVQERLGGDTRVDLGPARLTINPEFGSGGYAGLSASAEVGGDTYAILGLSRTNLRPFYNLNFDPGDAITWGIGSRAVARTELALYQVRDNRLGSGQQVSHLSWRYRPDDDQRLTIAASYKSGQTEDSVFIRGYGLSVGYDYKDYFFRIGREQHANFSPVPMSRFGVGLRF